MSITFILSRGGKWTLPSPETKIEGAVESPPEWDKKLEELPEDLKSKLLETFQRHKKGES